MRCWGFWPLFFWSRESILVKMIEDILKNIEEKLKEKLLRVNEEKEQAILSLEKKYGEFLIKQKENSLESFKRKIESEIQEFSQQKRREFEFAVLKEKNKIIDNLYKEAEKEITLENLKKLVSSLLPKEVRGKIRAGQKTAKIIREIRGIEAVNDLKEEGFVIIEEDAELDFRVSEILEQSKQERKPELIKLLFS